MTAVSAICDGSFDNLTSTSSYIEFSGPTSAGFTTFGCWQAAYDVNLVRNGNLAWGGLNPSVNTYYIALQKSRTGAVGGKIQQTITGLVAGSTYQLTFLAANRPAGCWPRCISTQLGVYIDSMREMTLNPPTTGFQKYQQTILATTTTLTVSFENMRDPTLDGDTSVFVADVTLTSGM